MTLKHAEQELIIEALETHLRELTVKADRLKDEMEFAPDDALLARTFRRMADDMTTCRKLIEVLDQGDAIIL